MSAAATSQDLVRQLKLAEGDTVEIVNRSGRVAVRAEPGTAEKPVTGTLVATSPTGVTEGEVKLNGGGNTNITVAADRGKRIDLIVTVPERTKLKIETAAGAVEVVGNFASVEAKTDTGTIVTDIPADDIKYNFLWTESRPRYLADFDVAEVKEKSAGRFELKGRRLGDGEVKSKKAKGKIDPAGDEQPAANNEPPSKTEDQKPKTVSLNFTTARGIILLNVPANEVMSDLRERPLTDAAKAIVRSGDSLLMEAIRRASPKYFGDYARTLPPLRFEPKFAVKSAQLEVPNATQKTAVVRVTDLRNRSISGLNAADFEVLENGTARNSVGIALDRSV